MEILAGILVGILAFLIFYCLLGGLYTIDQNERAVVTNFGKAERIGSATSLNLPFADISTLRKETATLILRFGLSDRAVPIFECRGKRSSRSPSRSKR